MIEERLLTPDGQHYWAMADGRRQAIPYHFRWLLPKLLGADFERWRLVMTCSLTTVCWGLVLYAHQHGVDIYKALFAGLLFAGLLGLRMLWLKTPVLTDLPSMALALLAAVVPWYWGIPIAVLGGCVRESTPVYAALYAWNPWLLLGLVAPAVRLCWEPGTEPDLRIRTILNHPWQSSWQKNRRVYSNPKVMLYQWGGLLAAVFVPSWQLLVTYLVCVSQALRAQDVVRQFLMAAPVVILPVVQLPWWALLLVVGVHLFLPWHKWVTLA